MIGGTRLNDITDQVLQDRNAELVELVHALVHDIDIRDREIALLRTLLASHMRPKKRLSFEEVFAMVCR